MIRNYRVDHVAQVVDDLEPWVRWLTDVFGFRVTHRWQDHGLGYRGMRMSTPGIRPHSWVVMEAEGSSGHPGLHHVGIEVPDLPVAIAELERRRMKVRVLDPGRWVEVSLSPPEGGVGMLFWIRGPGAPGLPGEQPVDETVTSDGGSTVGIVAINHVCQAFRDRDHLAKWYAGLAGFVEVWRTPEGVYPDMADLVLSVPGSEMYWEIMSPRGEDSFVERFLEKNGPTGHHVTFQVGDWRQAVAACRARGVPTFGEESGVLDGAEWHHLFIHPRDAAGTLVQLFWESHPGVWIRSKHVAPVEMGVKSSWI